MTEPSRSKVIAQHEKSPRCLFDATINGVSGDTVAKQPSYGKSMVIESSERLSLNCASCAMQLCVDTSSGEEVRKTQPCIYE